MSNTIIKELRILPPIAIGRLGASDTPLEAYDLKVSEEKPLGFREIIPKTSFIVDPQTGEITKAYLPESIKFKDVDSLEDKNGKIRPVSPILEVFAIVDHGENKKKEDEILEPLTLHLLEKAGYTVEDIEWEVHLGNIKIYRRTNNEDDKIYSKLPAIKDHKRHPVEGHCPNFLEGKTLPLGYVQFIKPTAEYPVIRFRYTPAAGKVYGSSRYRQTGPNTREKDPVINSDDLVIYDKDKGDWVGYEESGTNPLYTNPAQIFAGWSNAATGGQVSWGYLDDECDGVISVHLKKEDQSTLSAHAHVNAGPPAFAPDTLPVRVVSDELEQIIQGPFVDKDEVSIEEAEDIIRRAMETVRIMNTAIMNGNSYQGRQNVASTMVRQDTNDFERLYEPIMATSIVDNLAVQALHERVFNGLSTGAAAWFADAMRRPEEIGDLSNDGRRKMPGLMRGADGRGLTLTRRQIDTILQIALNGVFGGIKDNLPDKDKSPIRGEHKVAQLFYRGEGNPYSVLPRTAISNCFPGLEFDFRNLWRRTFQGITLIENNNYVIDTDKDNSDLLHHRLVGIIARPTMVPTEGPVFPNGDSVSLKTADNPNGVSFMEWSNNMIFALQHPGKEIECYFTKTKSVDEVVVTKEDLKHKDNFIVRKLKVNQIFDGNSTSINTEVVRPGELTQGLCAPWQNDYRECQCYYWAASRPDFVNIEPDDNGLATGDLWMAKKRTGHYIPDNINNSQLLSYDDLFINWQGELNFIIEGKDAISTKANDEKPQS